MPLSGFGVRCENPRIRHGRRHPHNGRLRLRGVAGDVDGACGMGGLVMHDLALLMGGFFLGASVFIFIAELVRK